MPATKNHWGDAAFGAASSFGESSGSLLLQLGHTHSLSDCQDKCLKCIPQEVEKDRTSDRLPGMPHSGAKVENNLA
ncbi:hypothetical protein SLEP1_g55116 [Rubroshorea leprosula]|uniref:Uncharacterized protein n=1 Tax=Rubroshorea leprosula TaxID=152421 RepID=A0AAV5MI83_9ROSI|nr:hypothetical protein SLEP1_g55116 [Rubroshorea leprosula]